MWGFKREARSYEDIMLDATNKWYNDIIQDADFIKMKSTYESKLQRLNDKWVLNPDEIESKTWLIWVLWLHEIKKIEVNITQKAISEIYWELEGKIYHS